MAFIDLVPTDAADERVRAMFSADETDGYVPNSTRALAHRPGVYEAWNDLLAAVRESMDLRRYELVTLAAARALRSSYCMLSHGGLVARELLPPDQLLDVVTDHHTAGLDEAEVAIMDYAGKVARDADSVTEADVQRLRDLGLADVEIFDVAAAAALRSFITKTMDALGVQPDSALAGLEPPELRDALTVGRAIEG